MLEIILLSPLLLAALYPLAIQYERGGAWRALGLLYIAAGLLSALVNYTWLSVLAGEWPRRGEYTTSQRCERLVHATGWLGALARGIARYTNRFDPTGPHIPLP